VFLATQLPEHYERLPERAWFSEIHYLALVCNNEVLARRLRERPAWRGMTDDRMREMQSFNQWLMTHATATSPPMTLLDTGESDPAATVAAVATWVRRRLDQT
jgi:hypothetical protein